MNSRSGMNAAQHDMEAVVRKAIAGVATIPTLPVVIERITRLLQNPQTSAEEIGRVITTDQALASKVLKLVNSAFYGFPGRISTITHAIVILGFNTVKNIILTASIFDFFQKRGTVHPDFDMEKFWMHSIACGAASQAIARFTGFNETEECFIAGLIHDIGKVVLCQFFPEQFGRAIDTARLKQELLFTAERETIGLTHQEVGGMLIDRWNLPKNLQSVVTAHHDPAAAAREYRQIIGVVHCADVLVRALDYGNGGDDTIPLVDAKVWEETGIATRPLGDLLEEIKAEFDKAQSLMNC